jgi:hypothetical protein
MHAAEYCIVVAEDEAVLRCCTAPFCSLVAGVWLCQLALNEFAREAKKQVTADDDDREGTAELQFIQ